MAGILAAVKSGAVSISNSDKTALQVVAAANHRVLIKEIAIAGTGTSNTDTPAIVKFAVQTDAGTSSAATPVKINQGDDETLQTTARHTATVEPTTGDVLFETRLHPQNTLIHQALYKEEFAVKGGQRFGVILNNPGGALDFEVWIKFEE